MAVGEAHVFPGFLTPVLTQLFFPKPLTTFLTCFSRGERQKYARKKVCLIQVSNSQPPGHESDTLTTEPPGQGLRIMENFFSPACGPGQTTFKIHFLLYSKASEVRGKSSQESQFAPTNYQTHNL